jgi:hypothetical protein
MALHLILLAANKVAPGLRGQVQIYSDCLGALNKVTTLPDNRFPSGFKHSNIPKNIMINCSKLSFGCTYLHVPAHQDDRKSFQQLPRPKQLNCCMDAGAKRELWGLEGNTLPPQSIFLLEPLAVFVGKDKLKLTSGSEDLLRYWCHRKMARIVLAHEKVNVLQQDQFDEVEWPAAYESLSVDVPRMFQIGGWHERNASKIHTKSR